MKRLTKTIAITLAGILFSSVPVSACTGVYVGKDVSQEGATILARSEDQGGGAYNKMFKVQKAETKKGRFFVDTGDDQDNFKIPLPKKTYKYTYVPDSSDAGDGMYPASCTNEYGVAVVGTVSADPSEEYQKEDPFVDRGLREAILPGLIACQVKTAKEAVELLAKLTDKYGSSEGNILFFADQNEAWVFEVYGGHTYAAMKMPADSVSVFGNQFMIGAVDQNDKENFRFSKNLFTTIDKVGAVKDGEQYNLAKSVSANIREEYSNLRTWRGKSILNPADTGEYNNDEFYPLFYKPDEKVAVSQVFDIYRDRYQGTAYDMVDPDKAKDNEDRRPIGVTRSSDIHVVQVYGDLPKKSNCVQWLCMGNAEYSVFIPSFSGITNTAKAYQVDGSAYNPKSAYWKFKRNETLAMADRENLGKGIQDFWRYQEKQEIKAISKQLNTVRKTFKDDNKKGHKLVTKLGIDMANEQIKNANMMYNSLMYTATDNFNDSTDPEDKDVFIAPITLDQVAADNGFKIKYKNKEDQLTATLVKGKTKIHVSEDNEIVTIKVGKKKHKVELAFPAYKVGKGLAVSFDILGAL